MGDRRTEPSLGPQEREQNLEQLRSNHNRATEAKITIRKEPNTAYCPEKEPSSHLVNFETHF